MRVRDAVEADAEAMAAIADGPTDVMRNLVHDRTVRVAEIDPKPSDDAGSTPSDDDGSTPSDDDGSTPSDDAGSTPSDDAGSTPSDDDGSTPSDDAGSPPDGADSAGESAASGTTTAAAQTTRSDGEPTPLEAVAGFVSFDAKADVVHVTQIDGSAAACELLLAEPVRFAKNEGMRVEVLVTDPDGAVATAAETLGFERDGPGPRFDGETTVRYGLQPS